MLGYPVPSLINWNESIQHDEWRANGTHIAKITGILRYLDGLRPEKDDELVVVVDGYDTWFQLRSDVLTSRYKEINRGVLDRTLGWMGSIAVAAEDITQGILFSAQKNCGPLKGQLDQVACYAQPESPLPTDLYGADTDTLDPENHLPLHMRPHFLCSGLIVGPVGSMRNMFRRAEQKIGQSNHTGSDQYIFNEIFGEQQYQREVIRLRYESLASKLSTAFRKIIGTYASSIVDPHPSHKPMEHLQGHPLELGISLDYGLQISHSAVLSEFDGRFLVYNSSESLRQQQIDAGVQNPTVKTLPDDIASSPVPFGALQDIGDLSALAAATPWTELPLYTNVWTASLPVTLHMNGFKEMRGALWDRLWFHQQAPNLLRRRKMNNDAAARDGLDGRLLQWDEMCKDFEPEIF